VPNVAGARCHILIGLADGAAQRFGSAVMMSMECRMMS